MQYAVAKVKTMGHKMLGQAALERLAGAEIAGAVASLAVLLTRTLLASCRADG